MTPGQIFWETAYGETRVAPWDDVAPVVRRRHEAGAQAVIDAHVSERENFILVLAALVRESVQHGVNTPDWVNRAHNALSRVQYAPTDQTPTVDTAQDDVIATMVGLIKEALGDIYDTPGGIFFAGLGWKQRAQNALSRLVDAPDAKTPAVDTQKPDNAPTGRPGALGRQVGGDHYHQAPMQPWDIIEAYGLDFWEGNVLKYLLRKKPGVIRAQDLAKAAHYLERCIERTAERP